MSELICLCCGKPLAESNGDTKNQWHEKCIYRFFGTTVFPEIAVSKDQLEKLAELSVSKGLTVAGVQKKLSLHLSKEKEHRLTLVGYPSGYILKPQTEEYKNLPEMENLVMNLAEISGINTVPHALVKINEELAYITKRIDRIIKSGKTAFLAMEDFCQLSGRLTEEKYKSSCEQCAKVIKKYSSKSGLDLSELFYRLVFCFVTGNSDMHLKNFSLIESSPASREFSLSPAYDLLPVNVALPEDKEESALTMNGKKANLKKQDFMKFGAVCGLNEKTSERLIQRIISYKKKYEELTEQSFLPEETRKTFMELMEKRIEVLAQS